MKTILVLLIGLSTVAAQANVPSIEAKILPRAKVLAVTCHSPSHIDHDWSIAGSAQILTAEGKQIEMWLAVSRFEDARVEAAKICKAIKALKASGKEYDIIYTEETSFIDEDEPLRMDFKGGGQLNALNPFYNG
jgi:hypothetical protein